MAAVPVDFTRESQYVYQVAAESGRQTPSSGATPTVQLQAISQQLQLIHKQLLCLNQATDITGMRNNEINNAM